MEYRIAESASGSAVLHITEVHALSSFRLRAKFSTGETRVLDFTPLLDTEAFRPLCDPALFGQVGLDHGVPVWQNGAIDLSPAYIYTQGSAV